MKSGLEKRLIGFRVPCSDFALEADIDYKVPGRFKENWRAFDWKLQGITLIRN